MRRQFALVAGGAFAAAFATAFATLLSAQLTLMSILDTGRVAVVADDVAASAFVAELVDDVVRSAVLPLTGPTVAAELGAAASTDDRVRSVLADSMVAAHRQVVDPSAPAGTTSAEVDARVPWVCEVWVCGVWAVGVLAVGWLISRVSATMFGELLDAPWSSAAPTLLTVVGGGLLLGLGTWLGGRAVDGLAGAGRPDPSRPGRGSVW